MTDETTEPSGPSLEDLVIEFTYTAEDGAPRTVALPMAELEFSDYTRVRKATGGIPLEAFLGEWTEGQEAIGFDSLCVLFWLARRRAGERANGNPIGFDAVTKGLTLSTAPEAAVIDLSEESSPEDPSEAEESEPITPVTPAESSAPSDSSLGSLSD